MGKSIINGISYGGAAEKAVNIKFDNSTSGLSSTNVQGAINELNEKAAADANKINGYSIEVMSVSEYENLGAYDSSTLYFCYED